MVSLISHNQQQYSSRRPLNLFVPRVNQRTFGLKSFYYLGTLLWNSLPENIKSTTDLNTFKRLIKSCMDKLVDVISVTLQMIKAKGQFGPTIVEHQISSYRF